MDNEINRTPFKFGKRVEKSEIYKNGWQTISTLDIDTSKPTVLCFNGNATINTTYANGMAKSAETMLQDLQSISQPEIYSIVYSSEQNFDTGSLNNEEISKLSKQLILPRIINNKGKPLSVEDCCKNMRNLNFLSHCYGQSVVNRIVKNSAKIMQTYFNFNEDETKTILSQILNITYSPTVKPSPYITNVMLESFSDERFGKIFEENFLTKHNLTTLPFMGAGFIEKDENTITIYAKSFESEIKTAFDEHDLIFITNNAYTENKNPRINTTYQIIKKALSYGVENSLNNQHNETFYPLSVTQLYKEINDILTNANKSDYEKKQRIMLYEEENKNLKSSFKLPVE